MKILSFLAVFFFTNTAIFSASYYLSNKGKDSNDGISESTAWNSISKLNYELKNIKAGDSILLERGSIFIGQINLNSSGDENGAITFGAYGVGKSPVISGSIPVRGWTIFKNNIYKTNADTIIKNLFVDGKQMILARFPNKGFLTIKEPLSNLEFIDGDLKHKSAYWNGSNVRLRTENWAYENSPVKNFAGGKITFSNPTYYPLQSGWGYYLDNNINELDTIGEWIFEDKNDFRNEVYFYPPPDLKLNDANVEGSAYAYGIYSHRELKNVIVKDLKFQNQFNSGIYFGGDKSGIKIINCTFSGQYISGLSFLNASRDCIVNNCRFLKINGKGIFIYSSRKMIISSNIFRDIGMFSGHGSTGDAFDLSAIVLLSGDSCHIHNNNINGVGHDGINCIGENNTIEKNAIFNVLLLLNDGGAIKSYGLSSKNSIWRNNFIFNVQGNLEGTPARYNEVKGEGIYLDESTNNMNVINNTIAFCNDAGIHLYDGCQRNYFNQNILYGNQIGIKFHYGKKPMTDNLTTENIFFSLNDHQASLLLRVNSSGYSPGKFDGNYYCNPNSETMFEYQLRNTVIGYNFTGWKKLLKNQSDMNSKIYYGKEIKFSRLLTNMSDDSKQISLGDGYSYKNFNMLPVSNFINIKPWSSEIIFANRDLTSLPEIAICGSSLYFENSERENILYSQWFNLICENLENTVEVTAPGGFEVSLNDDFGFSQSLTVSSSENKINEIIYVRFSPKDEESYNDFILVTSDKLEYKIKVKCEK